MVGTFDLLSFRFGVSLNSEQYRSQMLANPLFVCLTCFRPGAYVYILGESGSLRVTKRANKFCFGAIYNVRLWEKE